MDYAALAKQYGGTTAQPAVDYEALAKQYGGTSTIEQPSEIPGARTRSWSDVPVEALTNLPSSAAKFVGGMYEAVTSPVQTVKGVLDIGAGALQNITPKVVRDVVNRFETNPEAAQRAVATANAVGGEYARRYGSAEGFKEALATDPVAVISDFSTLLTGGAAATAKLAPNVSKGLTTAAAYTNPAAPIAKAAEYGLMGLSKGAGSVVDALQGQRAGIRAGNIVRNALTDDGRTPQNILAAQQAIRNAPAGSTVRQSLADVTAPQIQYLGEIMENRTPGVKMARQEAERAGRIARMEAVTPDLAAAEAIRSNTSKQLYGISDEALLPGRERQFRTVQTGTTKAGIPSYDPITGQPKMVPVGETSINVPGTTATRPVQIEVGRDSFNQPIYETRIISETTPSKTLQTQAVTTDALMNRAPVMEQALSTGGQPITKQILAGYKYDPQLAKLMERPAIQAAFDSAANIAANKGISLFTPNGQLTGSGAHLVKLSIDDAINPTPGTPIAKNTANALRSAKSEYLSWVEDKVPAYKTARETFKLQSEPVNQAQVLGAMREVLEQPLGVGERAAPFMTAMGRGEQALLKKATGEARFKELSDVLTPQQMKVVGGVESELLRDAKIAAQTKAGAEAMKTILDSNLSKSRTLPQFLDAKVTLTNEVLKILKGKLNNDVMVQLEKGFQSGTDFTKLMQKIPASERLNVLRALGQAKGQLSPTKLNILTQTQNAMAPQSESENALAP